MNNYFLFFKNVGFIEVIDILLVSVIIYYIYIWISKTAALPVLQGFLTVILLTFLAGIFELPTLEFLLQTVVSLMLISIIILFPSDIRRMFYKLGRTDFMIELLNLDTKYIDILVEIVARLKKNKTGALIIIRRRDSLAHIINSGVEIRASLNVQLIETIFNKHSLLHDGAVVISKNSVIAAACFIPGISFNIDNRHKFGTRHRAALSMSENTDGYAIIVSEETGGISIASEGSLKKDISLTKLRSELHKI